MRLFMQQSQTKAEIKRLVDLNKVLAENLESIKNIDNLSSDRFGKNYYAKLRDLLAAGDWERADKETCKQVYKLMACWENKKERFRSSDIEKIPCLDLQNIDRLWVKYSNGRFGFSVQKEIYLKCGGTLEGRYGKECEKALKKLKGAVGWGHRYSDNSTFNIEAKYGHLPACVHTLSDEVIVGGVVAEDFFSRIQTCNM